MGEFDIDLLKEAIAGLDDIDIPDLGFDDYELSLLTGKSMITDWDKGSLEDTGTGKERLIECPYCHKTFTKSGSSGEREYDDSIS